MVSYDEFYSSINLWDHPITEEEIQQLSEPEMESNLFELGTLGCLLPVHINHEDLYYFLYKIRCALSSKEMFDCVNTQVSEMLSEPASLTEEEYKWLLYKAMSYEFYTIRNGENYYQLKEAILQQCSGEELFSKRILQLFCAFEQSLYYPCACGALALIDGKLGAGANSSKTQFVTLLNEIVSNNVLTPSKIAIIPNLKGYLLSISKHADFLCGNEPCSLNRHWLMHGRDSRIIDRDDCIHLFNALEMILELES